MRKILIILSIISVAACNSAKKSTSSNTASFTLENLENMDAEELTKAFPDANIEEGSDFYDEGTDERPYSILYPGTADELHITWQDEDRKKIHDLRYTKNGKWTSKTGIKIGDSYDKLVALNKAPISFYGFGWDYSGAVDWEDGKLKNSDVRAFLSPQNEIPSDFYGDHVIEASPEQIQALDLKVSSIIINYNL
ncbi:hypothetical protein MKO06_06195 [Gramella sp. GC03-9]|uniref:Lipoprotein n=1 Tax=Christiangramia oceanisediminis TaxID=2920386 RepID=A0A9X2IB09_9FLAO|nr:hypothetical protein [Gramella oceanisediminis]MCP9199488.1 hypothetical protein [Gramella oceanisediminis]